ncbi:MAG: protease HtpX [Acidobacteria bacterium]|nr:protease HtpX [Acidobacteriota bacterium]
MNGIKTAALLALLSSILMIGGQMAGGRSGMMIGLAMAVAMNFFSYFFSEKIALSMSGAQAVTPESHGPIYARIGPMTQRLTQKMGLPMPRLWVTPEQTPNAFATGRNPAHSSVAVTYGLLQMMNDRELEGVIAHELGHIYNRDILISSVAATIGSAITQVGYMAYYFGGSRHSDEDEGGGGGGMIGGLVMMMVAPMAAGVIQMAISRTREFGADAAAAKYTGSPDGLISALGKLDSMGRRMPMEASPATAHMYIMKPFGGGGWSKLFSTHPPTEERIAALQALRFQ